MVLADGVVEPPLIEFFRSQGRQRHWRDKTDDELSEIIERAFLDTDVCVIAPLSDPEAPPNIGAMRTALGRMVQWWVAQWTLTQNRVRGVAPSTTSVLVHFEALWLQLPEGVRPSPWGTSRAVAPHKRISRWRRRWGGRYGALRVREIIPVPDMREKAMQ